jgi:hypothetical protein
VKSLKVKTADGKLINVTLYPVSPRVALKYGYKIIEIISSIMPKNINLAAISKTEIDIKRSVYSFIRKCPYEKLEDIILVMLDNCVFDNKPVSKDNFDAIFLGNFELIIELTVESVLYNFGGLFRPDLFSEIKKKMTK